MIDRAATDGEWRLPDDEAVVLLEIADAMDQRLTSRAPGGTGWQAELDMTAFIRTRGVFDSRPGHVALNPGILACGCFVGWSVVLSPAIASRVLATAEARGGPSFTTWDEVADMLVGPRPESAPDDMEWMSVRSFLTSPSWARTWGEGPAWAAARARCVAEHRRAPSWWPASGVLPTGVSQSTMSADLIPHLAPHLRRTARG